MEGRELHNNGLSEDTSSVLRDGGNDGNEIRENSRDFSSNKKTYNNKSGLEQPIREYEFDR